MDRASAELRATGQTKPRAGDSVLDRLTPQEFEIASLAASGLTNKQIAERLFLSHRTVSGHLHRAFPKLGVATRAALRDALASVPRSSSALSRDREHLGRDPIEPLSIVHDADQRSLPGGIRQQAQDHKVDCGAARVSYPRND